MRLVYYFFIGVICFFLGGGFMFLVDSTWLEDKVEIKERQSNDKMILYADALDEQKGTVLKQLHI